MRGKRLFLLFLITAAMVAIPGQALAQVFTPGPSGSSFKLAAGFTQYFVNKRDANPVALNGFIGERFSSFGDVGIYGQFLFQSKELSTYKSVGLAVAPALFRENWGSLLWDNKIGFANYLGRGHVHLSTGLKLEPGSYFHIGLDLMRPIPIKSGSNEKYPSAVGITLGVHFN